MSDAKSSSELSDFLQQAKNDIHQRQQLFIAQKSYAEALENAPAPDDTSSGATEANKTIETTHQHLLNLEQLVNGTTTTPSS